MYSSIDEVCNEIVQKQCPVIFIDTCSILDIVNSLHMSSLPEKYAIFALELSKLHGNKVWLVASENVAEELTDNIDTVITTMEKELVKADRNISAILLVINALLGASYSFPQKISSLNIATHMRSLSEGFLRKCLLLKRTDAHTLLAMQRVRKNEAPAKKGKPEPKDCEIVECFLEMCSQLRGIGFNERLVFFTANKQDFGKSGEIRSPLDVQFSQINAELSNNIEHVLAIVNGQAK